MNLYIHEMNLVNLSAACTSQIITAVKVQTRLPGTYKLYRISDKGAVNREGSESSTVPRITSPRSLKKWCCDKL